jgi:hypothetical protein
VDQIVEELRENTLQHSKTSIGMIELFRRGGLDLRGTIVGSVVAIAMAFSGIAGESFDFFQNSRN